MQLSRDCRYLQTTALFEVGEERFQCVGKTLLDPGYTAVLSWQAIPPDESVPPFKVGDACEISEVSGRETWQQFNLYRPGFSLRNMYIFKHLWFYYY